MSDFVVRAPEDPHLRIEMWGTQYCVPNFDGIARAYRWMEYLSLGNLLERTRFALLDAGALDVSRQALVLGDGDGRFTARLLARNPEVRVTAIDASARMLRLLRQRCVGFADRVEARQCDAREFALGPRVDLVATHFFLDCLTQAEVDELVKRVAVRLESGGRWVVSEFRVPEGWLRWPAAAFVCWLYLAFRMLTGLRVTRLPDHGAALRRAGLERVAETRLLCGILATELWVVR